MSREFLVKNQKETGELAKILAQEIKKKSLRIKRALIIGLQGDLGSGKTTFIKALAKGLGIKKRLTSPTFILMKKYKIPNHRLRIADYLFHIDCYRIKDYKDILALDFKEIISNPKNIVVIEWAEKVRKTLPKNTIWIKFKVISERERKIKVL